MTPENRSVLPEMKGTKEFDLEFRSKLESNASLTSPSSS